MLFKEIQKASLFARKDRSINARYLSSLISEIKQMEKDSLSDVFDIDAASQEILTKYIKNTQKNIELKPDDVSFVQELVLYMSFMPKQLLENELKDIILQFKENGATNIGAVMGSLKKNYNNQFDPKMASRIAKEVL